MKTRYWKDRASTKPRMWRVTDDTVDFQGHGSGKWEMSACTADSFEGDPSIIECDANGEPLSELAAGITLAEFDAFAARVRAQLAKMEEEAR